MAGRPALDWTVVGAIAAVTVVGAAVVYEAVALLGSDPTPAKRAPLLTGYGSTVERTAYDIPGFASSGTGERPPNFPLIRLIDPDRDPPPGATGAEPSPAAKAQGAAQPKKASPVPQGQTRPASGSDEIKVARSTPTEMNQSPPAATPVRTEQWRVIATVNASYFNLGGHIDRAGVVDGLATPHLREALAKHSKFGQLPADIRTHIMTQNIDLPKIAPYRGLLGMDDRILEQEQAVKFVRLR